jgi:uncharacterized protein (DUF1810 family)
VTGVAEDPFHLRRFVDAQEDAAIYARALGELRAGRKQGHWIWFVFPQIAGLGYSSMARAFAISGREEATAYLLHPVLGHRLRECAQALTALPGNDLEVILGGIDAVKVRSSMTLFAAVAPDEQGFTEVLAQYFGGEPDAATIARL